MHFSRRHAYCLRGSYRIPDDFFFSGIPCDDTSVFPLVLDNVPRMFFIFRSTGTASAVPASRAATPRGLTGGRKPEADLRGLQRCIAEAAPAVERTSGRADERHDRVVPPKPG